METTILYFFIYVIEAFILWWYCSNLFSAKYSKKYILLGISIGYLFLFLISLAKFAWLNTIIFTVINFTILLTLYHLKWNLCLFYSMVITCIMGLSEIVIAGLLSRFNGTILYTNTNFTIVITLTVLSKLLYFIGLRITMALVPGNVDNKGYTNKVTILLNIIPFISFYIVITLFSVLLNSDISNNFRNMLSSCAVLLLFMNFMIFYIYNDTQQKNKEFTELQIQLQKEYDMTEYYKTLFTQNENQQILIHDIRHHLSAIAQLNEQNDQNKIAHYLETLLNSTELQNSARFCDNDLLNSILCHYMKICQNSHITLKVDIRKKLLKNLEYSDLTALFCNLLTNAIEACSDIPDSYIDLSVTAKENTGITIINIINTCRIRPNFNRNGRPISIKKNKLKHGFGLKSVERVVDKYNGNIKMYFDEEKMAFHTVIFVKNNCNNINS
ncbi:sensor histidine kinase [Eubacterium sp.]